MQIANPIYDVVFKYMMNDKKVAKLILSSIIDSEIIDLDFGATEVQAEYNESLTVFRLDFKAKIKEKDGEEKLVLIEIQKAKLSSDIMRFRKYLGEQYSSDNNITHLSESQVPYGKALPIISIYFLGHKLKHTKAAAIKVSRTYTDLTTGKNIAEKEEFIESLTHDSYIIQIPFLKRSRRNDLEIVLSVFLQENFNKDEHILNIPEEFFPKKFLPIIRRLHRACSNAKLRKKMDLEDEIVAEFFHMEQTIKAQEKELEEKDSKLEEKDLTIEEKNKKLLNFAKYLKNNGSSLEDIIEHTGLSTSDIENL